MDANGAGSAQSDQKLSDLFDIIWKDYEFLETSDDPSNSESIQTKVQDAIGKAEKAVHMVNQVNLFSTNEQLEEVSTNELKYLLLPGLLGYFTNKSLKESRLEIVKKSQIYFADFIRLCRLYGMTDVDLPKPYHARVAATDDENSEEAQPQTLRAVSIEEQTKKRQMKIERFKAQREIQNNLSELYELVKMETVDEESKRNYFITLLKKWINDAVEAFESIEAEIPLLEHMEKMKYSKEPSQQQEKNKAGCKKGVIRPFIITKDAMQKQVFGLGYPGVPTFTVDEFYQQRVDQGLFPPAGTGSSVPENKNNVEQEEREREKEAKKKEADEDDDEAVHKARALDEWKDDHRRGWGNTKNKG